MRVNISEVMTGTVVAVTGDTPYKDVAEALIAHGISAVPVLDADGRVIGVVSEADLLLKEEFKDQYYREGYQPPLRARLRHRLARQAGRTRDRARGDTAAELMTSPAVTITPHQATVHAMRLMDENGVRRLPVVDPLGRLAGIVSRRDLLRVLVRPDAEIAREIREGVLDHDLWVDASRVRVSVDRGVATLSGSVARRSDARIAALMTLRVNGVVDVIDELEWDLDDVPARKDG